MNKMKQYFFFVVQMEQLYDMFLEAFDGYVITSFLFILC